MFWRKQKKQGFVQLDKDIAVMLKLSSDKKTWQSKQVYPVDYSITEGVKLEAKTFFEKGTEINYICFDNSRSILLDFPGDLSEKEIIKTVNLNRRDYFYTTDELSYAVQTPKSRKDLSLPLISYCTTNEVTELRKLSEKDGLTTGKITTAAGCLMGALKRQVPKLKDNINFIIQIGYSKVIVIAMKGYAPIQIEALFTGNIYDLETRLIQTFGIEKEEALNIIKNKSSSTIEGVYEVVERDRMEFINRVGSLISELRGSYMISDNSKIYISYSVMDEPDLTAAISERLSMEVVNLTGLKENEIAENASTAAVTWLSGCLTDIIPDINADAEKNQEVWHVSTKTAVICSIIFTLSPFLFLKWESDRINKYYVDATLKYDKVEELRNKLSQIESEQQQYEARISFISAELEKRGNLTKAIRFITENIPEMCRLDSLDFEQRNNKFSLTGYAADRETALQYFDKVSSYEAFNKPQFFCEQDSQNIDRVRFAISLTTK